jgi:HTH-type transcriptional regulator/antitoxin HigA
MGVALLSPNRYGRLLAKSLPRVIENEAEFDNMVGQLEALDFQGRPLTPEEQALGNLLARLIEDYDERRHPLPQLPPAEMLQWLLEQRGLRQRDLVSLLGASSVVSDVVNGKRSISKSQAKKLAAFFHVPVEVFL